MIKDIPIKERPRERVINNGVESLSDSELDLFAHAVESHMGPWNKDYEGNDQIITGIGLNPYYMWNVTDGLYSNIFYGANFVDYVGYVDNKLVMVRPSNGIEYETYILDQYFDIRIDGQAAADKVTLAAIAAINAIPDKVSYEDRHFVYAAREAYDKIATTVQQALVTNYADLISAEQRILALTPEDEVVDDNDDKNKDIGGKSIATVVYIMAAALIILCGIAVAVYYFVIKMKGRKVR